MRITGLLIAITIISATLTSAAKQYVVIDAADRSPIIGATVFDNSGIIEGLTDNDGRISISDNRAPITVRCIGYEPLSHTVANDTIVMQPSAYQLKEVVVTPIDRPIKRVLCFAREYSTGVTSTDTMQYYCEYMAEAYIVDGKVKGYKGYDSKPRTKAFKRYARISKDGVDSIFKPKYGDDITDLSWFDFMAFLPDKPIEVPTPILEGSPCDTIPGKYGPLFVYRKKNGQFTKTADVLSNHKDRRWSPFLFKLIGMTTDITAGSWTLSFADNEANKFGIDEFISGTFNIHMIGRGKWIKKVFNTKEPIEMDAYMELYPLEITTMTVEEYKEARDDYSGIPFQYPENIQPLSPAIEQLIQSIDGK